MKRSVAMRLKIAAAVAIAAAIFQGTALCAPPALGQQYRWKVSFRAELQAEPGALPTVSGITGDWRTTIVAVRPDAYDVRFQMTSIAIQGNHAGPVDPRELRLAQERLSKPFWITFGPDGLMRSVHFLKNVPPSDRNLLQTIATETQYVEAEATRPVWTTTERDGGGSYFAVYQRRDSTHVRKKKLKYVDAGVASAAGAANSSLSVTIEESETDFAFAPSGAIASIDGVQRLRLTIPGTKSNNLGTRIEIHLADMRPSMEPTAAVTLTPPRGVDDLPIITHQSDPKVALAETDKMLLDGHSTQAILSAVGSKDPMVDRRLAAMFRRRPESIALAMGRISEGPALHPITGALGQAGTDPAIRALRAVAQDVARPVVVRMSAILAIQVNRDPTVEAMQIPVSLFDDRDQQVRNAARLAGGAVARVGRANHPKESDAIEAALVARFTSAVTAAEKLEYMSALGNSAGPRALVVMTDALTDTREDIRAAAARGLRLIPGPETDTALTRTAKADSSAVVREAALFAIGFRAPLTAPVWETILNSARTDPADSVRKRAMSMLRNDASRPPETAETLSWIAQNDPSQAVRRFASESLSAIRAKGLRAEDAAAPSDGVIR